MTLRDQLQAALGDAYVVGRELGGGGMSRVFLVDDRRLGRTIVAKMLAPELAGAISAERFEREIRVAASLQQANIVPLIDAGDANGLPWFTMPYVEGQSLRARISSRVAIPIAECVSILRDVTRALGYAHERGFVHRDIKPDNVLLSRGAAEVTDFGIAKALDAARMPTASDTLTQLGTSVGTPAYMSPEQAAADPALDHRADIYAVGVLAYEMLTGQPPFMGTPQAVMAAHVHSVPPRIGRADVPPALVRLVMKCLEKDPAHRYQSADELLAEVDAVSTPSGALPSVIRARPGRVLGFTSAVAALLALVWFGTAGVRRERWVRTDAIPRIKGYVELAQYDSAWLLMRQARAVVPHDSTLDRLIPSFTRKAVLRSEPEGAQVFRAPLNDSTRWMLLGTTPTDTLLLPIAPAGLLRVEKEGYRTIVGIIGSYSRTFYLDKVTAPDSDMAHLPGGDLDIFLVGLDGQKPVPLGDFLMDKHEVTNRQFKAFVTGGGYTKPEYWPAGIDAAARSGFVDRTGRPGPATWEAGEYPSGQAELPVGGVNWYEAKAYAKFTGKALPTVFHWAHAASIGFARYIVPGSNFDSQGPRRGSTTRGMNLYGVFDMAGNVREWCENEAGGGERFILGGGWTDPAYGFTDAYAQPAMDRSAINGIRLVKYLRDEPNFAAASALQKRAFSNYAKESPVGDAVFESYRRAFDYDRGPLNARVESRDSTPDDWDIERVTFTAAYGDERMMAYVYTPKHGRPPYQSVLYFPHSGVISQSNSRNSREQLAAFVVKTGRALVLPIFKSTYERQDSLRSDIPDKSIFWREHVVMWVKDARRTLDYLGTRADMDTSRFAFFGYSWGSNQAPLTLALEPRLKAAVLLVAGLTMERGRSEVDPFNFLPRVKQPVLMLNGKYDFFFPLELAQKPFFEQLGTPADRKKYIVYEGGHDVPRTALIKETLAWLDKYLGEVR